MSLVDDYECREFRPSRLRPYTPKPEETFERPSCTTCDQDMWLIRAEPHAVLTAYDVWSCNYGVDRRECNAWALHVSGQSDNNSDNGAGCG